MLFQDRVKTPEDAAKAAEVLDNMIIQYHRLKRETRENDDLNSTTREMYDKGYAGVINDYEQELEMLVETWNLTC
jgi:hypothetical protein|tara:strand:+ start:194 stop:418 length:225 start_codon:yes stop_codon:yes gene_type:complete